MHTAKWAKCRSGQSIYVVGGSDEKPLVDAPLVELVLAGQEHPHFVAFFKLTKAHRAALVRGRVCTGRG